MVGCYDYIMAMAKGFTLEDRQKLNRKLFFRRIPERETVARSELSCMGSWDWAGNTPLHLLVAFGQIVRLMRNLALALTSEDIIIDVKDSTNERKLLLVACLLEHVELVEICLALGAYINTQGNMQLSPAHIIATNDVFSDIKKKLGEGRA